MNPKTILSGVLFAFAVGPHLGGMTKDQRKAIKQNARDAADEFFGEGVDVTFAEPDFERRIAEIEAEKNQLGKAAADELSMASAEIGQLRMQLEQANARIAELTKAPTAPPAATGTSGAAAAPAAPAKAAKG